MAPSNWPCLSLVRMADVGSFLSLTMRKYLCEAGPIMCAGCSNQVFGADGSSAVRTQPQELSIALQNGIGNHQEPYSTCIKKKTNFHFLSSHIIL